MLLLILLGVIFILPIIILSKINSLGNEIRYMNEKINALLMSKPQPAVPEELIAVRKDTEIYPPAPSLETENEVIQESPVEQTYPEYANEKFEYSPSIVKDESLDSPVAQEINTEEANERNVFERLLGTNWLSKIGIVTLVLGIGFFVKYAIDQEWINEIGRVGIGLLAGGIIIGIAHRLKDKYTVFSSILVGGGISVFYITITLAFREYALFGQTLAFALLIITTIFSVILSLLYNREELAVFSLLGGFASPLMVSSGAGDYVVLFSYILILNTGILVISYRKKWRIIGITSYLLTQTFFWIWMRSSYTNQIFNVSLFTSLFFIQFYLLALFDHFNSEEKKISAYQVFLILTNNLSAFLAYLYVFNNYTPNVRGLITLSLAVINAVVMVILSKNSRIDRNLFYLIIAIVLSFVSLAIPIQLKGHVITLFWAAESVILLWLWQKSRINVLFTGFILISILMLFSYLMDANNLYSYNLAMPLMTNRLFITGIVVVAAFVINRLLLKRESSEENFASLLEKIFRFGIIMLTYVVLYLELDIQLGQHVNINHYGSSNFCHIVLATFTIIYIAVLSIIYNKKVASKKYIFGLLYLTIFFYAIFYTNLVTDLRYTIFKLSEKAYTVSYFSIHLFSLPAIAYIVYLVTKNIKSLPTKQSTCLSWLLTILTVVILSVETEHIIVWISGNPNNYDDVLYDVHTIGYPILWGIIAMILMIWGLNRKEALLRKISLVFFGFIIIKFYAYDVWKMSQSGRIISFVLLGVILLLVSFLQQKIRTWVKNDNEKENDEISQ